MTIEQIESAIDVERAIGKLLEPQRSWALLVLAGYSSTEASQILGSTECTCSFDARRRLRVLLELNDRGPH